jgi:hypothetical protein
MTLPAHISDLVGNLVAAQAITPQPVGSDFLYLKMDKNGEWLYGADDTEVDSQSAFVIDPATYAQGFVSWYDGELMAEKMATAGTPPVTMADLPELPDKPKTTLTGVFGAHKYLLRLKVLKVPKKVYSFYTKYLLKVVVKRSLSC